MLINAKSDQNEAHCLRCATSIESNPSEVIRCTVALAVAPDVLLGASIAIDTKSSAEVLEVLVHLNAVAVLPPESKGCVTTARPLANDGKQPGAPFLDEHTSAFGWQPEEQPEEHTASGFGSYPAG